MPKLLKFILNCLATITALGSFWITFNVLITIVKGEARDAGPGLWILMLIFIAMHRVPIMVAEFILIRPLLGGIHVNKELIKINIYLVFSLFLSSIVCTRIFLTQLNRWIPLLKWRYVFWGLIVLITGLVALAEVYIKTDAFMEKHLTTNPKKVTPFLSAIIISVYLGFVAVCALILYYLKHAIIWNPI